MDEAFAGLPGFRCVIDNIDIYDGDITQHTQHIRQFLQRCAEKRITLNLSKWKFAWSTVSFAGSSAESQIDPSITQAIESFLTPTSRKDLAPSSNWSTSYHHPRQAYLTCCHRYAHS